jgi:hypothetical protein
MCPRRPNFALGGRDPFRSRAASVTMEQASDTLARMNLSYQPHTGLRNSGAAPHNHHALCAQFSEVRFYACRVDKLITGVYDPSIFRFVAILKGIERYARSNVAN